MPTLPTSEQHATISYIELDDGSSAPDVHDFVQPLPIETRVDTIRIYNSDSVAHRLRVAICDPGNNARLADPITVPAAAGGNEGTIPYALNLPLPALWFIKIWLGEAIGSGEKVRLFAFGGTL